jgi:hypothetical protein
MPTAPQGVFDLGRWLVPMIVIGGAWTLVTNRSLVLLPSRRQNVKHLKPLVCNGYQVFDARHCPKEACQKTAVCYKKFS